MRVPGRVEVLHAIAPLLVGLIGGCAALDPTPTTMAERLRALPTANLPLERPVTVRWNNYQIPFIEAETDRDLAFALGLVHAHLRLAQIRLMKQVAQGRLSEMAGPMARDADQAIRTLDVGRAAPEMVRHLTPESRALLDSFVAGLNFYQAHMPKPPPEFALLGLKPEPFTPEDLVTIGRLSGIDVNWLVAMSLLPLRNRADWPEIWRRALDTGAGQTTSFDGEAIGGMLRDIVAGAVRSGSNAVVVAPEKSASGAALIAGDPHLGVSVPNLWLLAGMRSPSFTGVGLMIPGLPFIAEGRTPTLAWAGTNMRSANSDFYDIARLDDADIESRATTIKTRFWFDAERTIRSSRLGPVISDSPFVTTRPGEIIALRWIGHQPTREIDDLFAIMRAKDAGEFRRALAGFAVSPQNFLCADTKGNICQVMATVLPERSNAPPKDLVLDAADPANDWHGLADAESLPFSLNPPEHFLASANNRPTTTPFPIGRFFNSEERISRLKSLLTTNTAVSLGDLRALQQDTVSENARGLAAALAQAIAADPVAGAVDPAFLAELQRFDGDYRAEAHGPVVFETLLYHLVPAVYGAGSPDDLPGPTTSFPQIARFLMGDLDKLDPPRRQRVLADAVKAAAADSATFATWGEMHRLRIKHWLANLPLVGGYFVYGDYPVGGSRETIMKTAHGLTNRVNAASYGSQARFLADMGDLDANEFVLIGGNDGWLGSANALDQVTPWMKGETIRMPLRPETVAKEFPVVTVLTGGTDR
jgi:penicillin amidase